MRTPYNGAENILMKTNKKIKNIFKKIKKGIDKNNLLEYNGKVKTKNRINNKTSQISF